MDTPLTKLNLLKSICDDITDAVDRTHFWNESLNLSISSIATSVEHFQLALDRRDQKQLAHAAHKIAGTICFFGVEILTEELHHLQRQCEQDAISWPIVKAASYLSDLKSIQVELARAKLHPP